MDPMAIYEDLKEKIIWLEHKPESTFNLTELAQHYGVSRNPITLALTRLDAEGWVSRHGSHFVVSPLSLNRIREITEIRSVMEVQAYKWAIQRITPEEIEQVTRLKTKIRKISKSASNQDIVRMDLAFHRLLYQAAKNEELYHLLERLLNHYLRFWLSIPRRIDRESFFHEHMEIIDAVLAKDEELLCEAASEHIKKSVEEIIGSF